MTSITYLQQLPSHPFELVGYRKATVQFNGHVQVDFQNYSVPFDYIKHKVDVRLTRYAVEVLCDGNRILLPSAPVRTQWAVQHR